jgi:hypothetical protein
MAVIAKLAAVLLLLVAAASAALVRLPRGHAANAHRGTMRAGLSQFPFPSYKQCDPRWGNDTMGTVGNGERSTICGEGCAMTSVSMALAGLGAKGSDGKPVTPKTFNEWLINNGGYLCAGGDCNNLNLTAPERFNRSMTLIGESPKPSFNKIVHDIKSRAVIHVAHVRNNSHFVLLGYTAADGSEGFFVHDPFYPATVYPYANITDIISFHVDKYPMYKQCDARWANVVMGQNNETICQVGCLMSSITMALAGTHIDVDGQPATPPVTDQFLQTHHGFVDGSSALSESVIATIDPKRVQWPKDGMHLSNDISWGNITDMLDRDVPRIVIANVMHGQHFVLITGYRADGDSLVVNDPGFNTDTYSYSQDVVGWRIFDMK